MTTITFCMKPFSSKWKTVSARLVSYSVHEGKHFYVSAVSGLFLKLIYHGARYGCLSPATRVFHALSFGTSVGMDVSIIKLMDLYLLH